MVGPSSSSRASLAPRWRASAVLVVVALLLVGAASGVEARGGPAEPGPPADRGKPADSPGGPRSTDNAVPVAEDVTVMAWATDGTIEAEVVATDADGDALRFLLPDSDLIRGADDSAGCDLLGDATSRCTLGITLAVPDVPGEYGFSYRVSDGTVTAPKPGTVTLTVADPLTVEPVTVQAVARDPEFSRSTPTASRVRQFVELRGTSGTGTPFAFVIPEIAGVTEHLSAASGGNLDCTGDDGVWTCAPIVCEVDPGSGARHCAGELQVGFWARAGDNVLEYHAVDEDGWRGPPAAITVQIPFTLPFFATQVDGPDLRWSTALWRWLWGGALSSGQHVPGGPKAALLQGETHEIEVFEDVDPERLEHLTVEVGEQRVAVPTTAPGDDGLRPETCITGSPTLDEYGHLHIEAAPLPLLEDGPQWPCWVELRVADAGWELEQSLWVMVLRTPERFQRLEAELPVLRYDPSLATQQPVITRIMSGSIPGERFHVWWNDRTHLDVAVVGEELLLTPKVAVDTPRVVTIILSAPGGEEERTWDLQRRLDREIHLTVVLEPPTRSSVVFVDDTLQIDLESLQLPTTTTSVDTSHTIVLSSTLQIGTQVLSLSTGTLDLSSSNDGVLILTNPDSPSITTAELTVSGCIDLVSGFDCGNPPQIETVGGAEAFLEGTVVGSQPTTPYGWVLDIGGLIVLP
jgi:hypothetical protein